MKILVLGGSSMIGAEITRQFASKNDFLFLGRQTESLKKLATSTLKAGAASAKFIPFDLANDPTPLKTEVSTFAPDLVIWAASATSRLRDSSIHTHEMYAYTHVDVVSPIQLLHQLLTSLDKPFDVIFITSLLAIVRSPDRDIYSGYKSLCEALLKRMQTQHPKKLNLFVARICSIMNNDQENKKTKKISKKIFDAYKKNKRNINIGLSGKLILTLNFIHPALTWLTLRLQRKIRQSLGKTKK